MTNKQLRRKFELLRRVLKDLERDKALILQESEKLQKELEDRGVKL